MTADAHARRIGEVLADAVGPEHVSSGAEAACGAIDGVAPRWTVRPGSVAEVSRCLALAAGAGLAVAPTGRGARLGWGNPPRSLDVALSLARLDRILAHEPADLTVSVEAGVTLAALNARVGPDRQMLPLDPARSDESTVGGVIATATSGPYRARYGTMRELLLGVTVVQADGTVVKAGGRVVKNVTGYDMAKLYVGALGTLGVVVEAHLRLHPRPAQEETWLFGFASAESALEAAVAIRETPVVASRLQLLDAGALGGLGGEAAPAALAVTIGSVPAAVRSQGDRVAEICRRGGGTTKLVADADAWWRRVSDATLPPDPDTSLTLRIGSRPSDVVKALRTVEAGAGSKAGLAVAATAEVANGVLHVVLSGSGVSDAPGIVRRVRDGLGAIQATCVVEHAPRAVKAETEAWGDAGPALAGMRRLKAELDPRGVLNPGRFVGGI